MKKRSTKYLSHAKIMPLWQAIAKNMIMLSKDELFEQYKKDGLKLIW
jgi:hypothetical protein